MLKKLIYIDLRMSSEPVLIENRTDTQFPAMEIACEAYRDIKDMLTAKWKKNPLFRKDVSDAAWTLSLMPYWGEKGSYRFFRGCAGFNHEEALLTTIALRSVQYITTAVALAEYYFR